ncbi:MAG: DUF2256 domain-containing protein [Rubrivivax sp.]|nr:DUF2256 domain-containing protein [Rubrivivax sp.]
MTRSSQGFKGNKAHLPQKPCSTCGRAMVWRKAWARCWDEVRHCSEACRRDRRQRAGDTPGQPLAATPRG